MANRPYIPLLVAALGLLALSACSQRVLATPLVLPSPVAPGTAVAEDVPTTAPAADLPPGFLTAPTVDHGVIVLPEVDPAAFSGDIITAGSSTVFPLSERMAERFQDEGFRGHITVDSIGSGAGFERFCVAGETDIANASRAIKPSEVESCRKIGREPLEFRVGTDALAVVVSKDNDFIDNLTLEELALAFSTARTWRDIRPEWPDQPILRFSPGTDSGTFDFFVEHVFHKDETQLLNAPNLNLSEDDNVLVQGVSGSPYGIGYFGFAYYLHNEDRLRAVPIEGVQPTAETAESGEYPLARPLFIYSDPTILRAKPQVAAFIAFYLTYVNDEIEDVGYFPTSVEALNRAKALWLEALGFEVPRP